jgi:site-specific DNA-methyltransferase (adenine-specific)
MKPYYQDGAVTIYNGDCLNVLPNVVSDAVLTDPPYGTGGYGPGRHFWESTKTVQAWDVVDCRFMELAKADIAIVWSGTPMIFDLFQHALAGGWEPHPMMVMHKTNARPGTRGIMRLTLEPIFVFRKSKKARLVGGDDLIKTTVLQGRVHPHQKQLAVVREIVRRLPKARTFCDPFAGSGTTGVACKQEGRMAVLIEKEERYCELAARRCSQEIDFHAAPGGTYGQ